MIITIENDILLATIKAKGAELNRVYNKKTQLEYMWNGNPAVWGKTSPILFPIVGTLKDDTFVYQEKSFSLTRHGFARDCQFEIAEQSQSEVSFVLRSNDDSIKKYPFQFELVVRYFLEGDVLHVLYDVKNADSKRMYFSLGAHPAFSVPLLPGTQYDDYYLKFNCTENFDRWPITKDGLIDRSPVSLGTSDRINLTKALFKQDALVFKHLKSEQIDLKSDKHGHGLSFMFKDFPFMGIWAAPNADFVCIEPWCGIADNVNHNQQLSNKEGIEQIEPGECWSRSWQVKFY